MVHMRMGSKASRGQNAHCSKSFFLFQVLLHKIFMILQHENYYKNHEKSTYLLSCASMGLTSFNLTKLVYVAVEYTYYRASDCHSIDFDLFYTFTSGLQVQPPGFMRPRRGRKKSVWEESDSDDEEWRPSGPKRKKSSSRGN